jgi:hypothetical protein
VFVLFYHKSWKIKIHNKMRFSLDVERALRGFVQRNFFSSRIKMSVKGFEESVTFDMILDTHNSVL